MLRWWMPSLKKRLYPTLRLALRLLLADVLVGVGVRVLGLSHHTGVEYALRTLALAGALQPPLS